MSNGNQNDGHLPSGWIVAFRIAWLFLFFMLLVLYFAGLRPRYDELRTPCDDPFCVVLVLSSQEEALLLDQGLSLDHYAGYHIALELVTTLLTTLLALFIFWRNFNDWIGILAAFMLILFSLNFMVEADSSFVNLSPQFGPIHDFLTVLAVAPLTLLLFLFPSGRFVPRWTRWTGLFLVVMILLDTFLFSSEAMIPSGQFSYLLTIVILPLLLLGLIAQIYRYRRVSGPVERLQTKWIVLGFGIIIIAIFTWAIFVEIYPLPAGPLRLLFNTVVFGILTLVLLIFPLTFFVSIIRYRLWDIDLVIRRTLLYTLLTGLLLLAYFGSVTLLQTLFTAVSGQKSAVAIVISTLVIAALFNPLRHRLQDLVDRRFFRKKYDAKKVLSAFNARAGEEVDLDELAAEMVRVVQETMQPANISLWLQDKIEER